MRIIIFCMISSLLLTGSCESSKPSPEPTTKAQPKVIIDATPEPLKELPEEISSEQYKKLIFNAKLSISPSKPNWVLFSNGTYFLFPKGTSEANMRQSSLGLLQRYNNESFKIQKSPIVKGWIASSRKGVYNYVSLDQAGDRMTPDSELAKIGKANVLKDKDNPIIIHVNVPK